MTQPHDQHDQAATALRLDVALGQLTQPGRHPLDRAASDVESQLREHRTNLARTYLATLRALARERTAARRWPEPDHRATAFARISARTATARLHHRHRWAQLTTALTTPTAVLPSLLDQLDAAVGNSGNLGTGPAAAAAQRSPIGLAALELLIEIQHHTGIHDRTHLASSLTAWAHHDIRTADDATVAEAWVEQARALLTPPRGRGIPGRCTRCGADWVDVDDAGETVRRRALDVTIDITTRQATTRCLRCGQLWPPERAGILAAALEQQAAEDAADRAAARATGRRADAHSGRR